MSAVTAHMDGMSLGDQKPCLTQRRRNESRRLLSAAVGYKSRTMQASSKLSPRTLCGKHPSRTAPVNRGREEHEVHRGG